MPKGYKLGSSGRIGIYEKPWSAVGGVGAVPGRTVVLCGHVRGKAGEQGGYFRVQFQIAAFQTEGCKFPVSGKALFQESKTFFVGYDKFNICAHLHAGARDGETPYKVSGCDLTVSICSKVNVSHCFLRYVRLFSGYFTVIFTADLSDVQYNIKVFA